MIGHWHRGGFGYFTQLVLSLNHTYKAEWSGDEIDPDTMRPAVYGQASGKWKLERDLLVLIPTRETKETKGDLRSMKLVQQHRKLVLLPRRPLPVATMFHLNPMIVFERDE